MNTTANTVTFTTSHFSTFAVLAIKDTPEIKLVSPINNGYVSKDPVINVEARDAFSAIANFRIEIDGTDLTAFLNGRADSDGIDNDGNGIIDEKEGVNAEEVATTQINENSAKYLIRAPLNLSNGEHTLTVTAFNILGRSTSNTIKFKVTNQLDITDVYNFPNPFNPTKELTTLKFNLTSDANITVKIYDFNGNLVSTIKNNELMYANTNSQISWGGTDNTAGKYLANDAYFCCIQAQAVDGTKTVTKMLKIVVLR